MSEAGALTVTMVRCATLILEWGGVRLLTDPWFAMHLRGLPCFRRPGLTPAQVGRLDAVLASHLHPDHFDRRALARLAPPPPLVLLPPGARRALGPQWPASHREQAPWESARLGGLTVTAVPARHTGPAPEEINFVLDLPGWGRVFFGGDARLDRPLLREVAARCAPVRLALLPVGGTRILGRRTVMGPDDALEAALALGADTVIPIHQGGLWLSVPPLSLHPGRARHLVDLARRSGAGLRVLVLAEGESASL
jgi:L-ascorbate metabolism protein UlaG (beta-lactamase superfamily)